MQAEGQNAHNARNPRNPCVYAGDGKVIEARGFHYGVVETKLSERPWENWGKCLWIKYPESLRCFAKCAKTETSIVDALKSLGENSGFDYRRRIALANGIAEYVGTAKQNITMLTLLKNGLLLRPEAYV